jgi:hypothetical protein
MNFAVGVCVRVCGQRVETYKPRLDDVEEKKLFGLPGLELRPRSQSLYRLHYPGSRPVL